MFLRKLHVLVALLTITSSNLFSAYAAHQKKTSLRTRVLEYLTRHRRASNALSLTLAAATGYLIHTSLIKGETWQDTTKRYALVTTACMLGITSECIATNIKNNSTTVAVSQHLATTGRTLVLNRLAELLLLTRNPEAKHSNNAPVDNNQLSTYTQIN